MEGFLDFSQVEGEIRFDPDPSLDADSIVIAGFAVRVSGTQSERLFHDLLTSYMGEGNESQKEVIKRVLGPWITPPGGFAVGDYVKLNGVSIWGCDRHAVYRITALTGLTAKLVLIGDPEATIPEVCRASLVAPSPEELKAAESEEIPF